MLEARANWRFPSAEQEEEEHARQLADELQLHPLAARLLLARGMKDPEEIRRFLLTNEDGWHDPFELDGMQEAVNRIRQALEKRERIRVYGDYDADGVSSTALMTFLMRRLQADFDTYIPHRINEGYGLNKGALLAAKQAGVALIVTVDTGISAREEIAYAAEIGLDVIVTDHHEPPVELPNAVALINPKLEGNRYPYPYLAGVGVAFKLAHALLGEPPLEWLDIAALGTIADLMPLTGENRLMVKLGLERMRQTGNPGMLALLQVANVDRKVLNEGNVAFAMAPRINASGRLEHANTALRLLTTEDANEAVVLAGQLDALNKERQRIVDDLTKEALAIMEENGLSAYGHRTTVVAGEGWNVGVVGIAASRLLEKYYRPTVVLAIDPATGMAKGSARSIPGFDIYRALSTCRDLFEHFGGHQAAAGLSLRRENVPILAERLEQLAQDWLTEEDIIPVLQADLACTLEEADLEAIGQLSQLAPFGMGNPAPRFVFQELRVKDKRMMGKEGQHLKLMLETVLESAASESACSVEAVGFGYGAVAERIAPASSIDVLGELSINEWNGMRRPQIMIQDLRIKKPQLFDWRGSLPSVERLSSIGAERFAILVFDEREQRLVPKEWLKRGGSVWLAPEQAGRAPERLLPAGSEGENEDASFYQLKDMVLLTLPPDQKRMGVALRSAGTIARFYAVFADSEETPTGALPSRDAFKSVYAALSREGLWTADDSRLYAAYAKRFGLSQANVRFILRVFEELAFIQRDGAACTINPSPAKRDLTESPHYCRLQQRGSVEQTYIYTSIQELTEHLMSFILMSTMEE